MANELDFLNSDKVAKLLSPQGDPGDHDLLARIFNAPEEQIETFADVLKAESIIAEKGSSEEDFVTKAVRGETTPIAKEFSSEELVQGFIKIVNGWNKNDYVWHISPAHAQKPWTVSIERVIFALVHTLNQVIPREQIVDIYPPYSDWDIAEITLKALNLKECWSIDQKDIDELNLKFLKVLNPLVL